MVGSVGRWRKIKEGQIMSDSKALELKKGKEMAGSKTKVTSFFS